MKAAKDKKNYTRIDWDEVRERGVKEGVWEVEAEPEEKKERRKRKRTEVEEESEEEQSGGDYAPSGNSDEEEIASAGDEEEGEDAEASDAASAASDRPRKARRSGAGSSPTKTPRKRGRSPKTTLTAKGRLQRKPSRGSLKSPTKARRPVPIASNSKWAASLPSDPYLRALATLHVSATPDDLPCRDEEFERVLGKVEGLLEEGEGGCIYISGVPGTGKTATVHAVVRTLHARAQASEIPPFTFLEVNGLKLTDAREAYAELWRVVSGDDMDKRVSPGEALRRLVGYFERSGRRGPEAGCFVVLMDELDQLITTKQDVVYNFFNWPTLPGSRLVVIAVANTMDLPERVMAGKVRSRLGMERINFAPYTRDQLKEIVNSRLRGGTVPPEQIMHADAIQIAAMRVAGVSGDARRILDISRRAVELARQHDGSFRTVLINDVNSVMKQMQNSPAASYLRECSYMEKVMLVAVVKVIRREGVPEVKWGDVTYQHLGLYATLGDSKLPPAKPTLRELKMVLGSLMAAKVLLFEEGVLATRKAEGDRKVQLGLESGEIERVLGDWGGQTWKNLLGVN
ncbi:P-loop containing nucleoside triphosphate hydrolase protein [Calocera cornea HHB12733]|uniref:Origin recognition complex subunit 1 n=1 Tax=Calocera cornea HHB12733 TaxID=1353952 RepID=A0A165E0K4_9BASI|nr:P-loop containing nucleoside triphosphate hydrolase protein [Calocera cornea HHB12733]